MAISKKQVEDATKPVSDKDMAQSAWEAQEVSKNIQRQFGDKRSPIVAPSAFRTADAAIPAKQAEFQRRQQFLPQAYQTIAEVEEKQTGIQDEVADFYDKWNLKADELMMKQDQARRGADLETQQVLQGVEEKMRDIEFTSFQNAAKRYDAMEEAYQKGDAEKSLIQAGINGTIKVKDVEKYWDMVVQDIQEDLKDWRQMTELEFNTWKQKIAAKSKNAAKFIEGATDLFKTGIDEGLKEDKEGKTGFERLLESDKGDAQEIDNARARGRDAVWTEVDDGYSDEVSPGMIS